MAHRSIGEAKDKARIVGVGSLCRLQDVGPEVWLAELERLTGRKTSKRKCCNSCSCSCNWKMSADHDLLQHLPFEEQSDSIIAKINRRSWEVTLRAKLQWQVPPQSQGSLSPTDFPLSSFGSAALSHAQAELSSCIKNRATSPVWNRTWNACARCLLPRPCAATRAMPYILQVIVPDGMTKLIKRSASRPYSDMSFVLSDHGKATL